MHRKVCLLHGIGRVRKSQPAAEFARKHQKDFSANFWIASSTKEIWGESFAALAEDYLNIKFRKSLNLHQKTTLEILME